MIIDTGGLLIVLLVLIVPVAVWLIQRGTRTRTNVLLAEIAERQRELAGAPDPLAEITAASSPAEIDAAIHCGQLRREIAALASRLPPKLRGQSGLGA